MWACEKEIYNKGNVLNSPCFHCLDTLNIIKTVSVKHVTLDYCRIYYYNVCCTFSNK